MKEKDTVFLQTLGRFIHDQVNKAVAPLLDRIQKQEELIKSFNQPEFDWTKLGRMVDERVALIPIPKDGKDAEINIDEIKAFILNQVNQQFHDFPIKDGVPGKDADNDMILSKLMGQLHETLDSWPKPKDGAPGNDGKSISLDDVKPFLSELVTNAVAAIPIPKSVVGGHINRSGALCLVFSDGSDKELGVVVGKDASREDMIAAVKDEVAKYPIPKDGKDGKDGFGFDDLDVVFDGERTFTLVFTKGENKKEWPIKFSVPLYREVWRAGKYEKGDTVTHEGSSFIAIEDTETQPGTLNCGWRLATKRGREGKPGEPGKPGKPGKNGEPGRDLTQLGPNGQKW